jgi:hypothetical protein
MNHPIAIDLRSRLAPEATSGHPPLWRRAAQAVWRFAESCGHARATGELRRLAQVYQATNPELAQRFRDTAKWRG